MEADTRESLKEENLGGKVIKKEMKEGMSYII